MDINDIKSLKEADTNDVLFGDTPNNLMAACSVYHILNSFLDGEFDDQHEELEQKGSSVLHYVSALIAVTVIRSHSHEWDDAEWQIKLIDEAREALRDQSC